MRLINKSEALRISRADIRGVKGAAKAKCKRITDRPKSLAEADERGRVVVVEKLLDILMWLRTKDVSCSIIEEAIDVAGSEIESHYKPVLIKMLKPRRPGTGLENTRMVARFRKFADWDEITNPIEPPPPEQPNRWARHGTLGDPEPGLTHMVSFVRGATWP